MGKPFTGQHMAALLVGAFAVILTVNLVMARLASSTFGGEVVENSYVASQEFNRWLDKAETSKRLGWTVEPYRLADHRIGLRLAGVPAGAAISAVARHPLGREADKPLAFTADGNGHYASVEPLPDGRWLLRIAVKGGADEWRGEAQVR